ncbi:hypothetical protein BH10ACI3_BH10ACI3_27960 [soil metagenome]
MFMTGCKPAESGDTAPVPPAETAKTESPFPNKDPEKYQVEIWQTSPTGTEKFLVARDGTKWRFDSAYGDPSQITTIRTDKEIVISVANKVYAEYPPAHGYDERENTISEMTLKMLNSTGKGTFEKIGTEGTVTRYKVMSDDDKGKESVISFDEKLGLPVKKEIYKGTGADRTLEMTVTLNGFTTEVDPAMFTVPKDVKKVSIDEMKKALSGTK